MRPREGSSGGGGRGAVNPFLPASGEKPRSRAGVEGGAGVRPVPPRAVTSRRPRPKLRPRSHHPPPAPAARAAGAPRPGGALRRDPDLVVGLGVPAAGREGETRKRKEEKAHTHLLRAACVSGVQPRARLDLIHLSCASSRPAWLPHCSDAETKA